MTFTIEFFRIRERDNAHVMLDVKGGRALRNVPAPSVTLSGQCRVRSPVTASSRPSRLCRPRRATLRQVGLSKLAAGKVVRMVQTLARAWRVAAAT